LNVPRCFLAKAGDDGRTLNLVLEDLSTRTRLGNQIAGCSIAEAKAVVTEFAKLHRAYWKDPRLATASWLYDRPRWADQTDASYAHGAAALRHRFEGRIDPFYLDAMDGFAHLAGELTHRAARGETLVHGEARVDNILFADTASGPEAWLIDWQFADRGTPMYDTAYFLAGSLTTEDRRACDRDLIAFHQAELAQIDPAYSLERATNEFAQALPFALFTTVGAALAVPAGEHADRLLMTLLTRNIDALADWGQIPG
jgi:aminoglycoside phosphotransferase (APT) family kinase protein